MNSSYVFGGGDTRKISALPPGDYSFSVTECPEPYEKDDGKWVLNVRLSILPNGETVFAPIWSGVDKNGNERDQIGEFLIAVNRAPKVGEEPNWAKIVGARGRCRLKIETAQMGALAGKEVNKVHYFYKPKQLNPPADMPKDNRVDVAKTRGQPAQQPSGSEQEPDDIPF